MTQPASRLAIGVAAAAALAGVAVVPGSFARGAPVFTENPGHAQPAERATGAEDHPYGWFGVNGAHTWEVYRKFTTSAGVTPPQELEPRVENAPTNSVLATFFNQTSQNPYWNGSGIWFGPAGNSTPTDYQLVISHPYVVDQTTGTRSEWIGAMDIRVGFVESANAGAMVNQARNPIAGGDGRFGEPSEVDWWLPPHADAINMFANLEQNGNVSASNGTSRAATNNNNEGASTDITVIRTGTAGNGPRAVAGRIFNDPDNANAPTLEMRIGGWKGTYAIPSLTNDGDGLPFDDGLNLNAVTPVVYLNKGGGDASGTAHRMDTWITIRGDASLDGRVNGTDFALLAGNFGKTERGWTEGDFNLDGAVNGSDFALLAGNFGKNVPGVTGLVTESDWAALESFGASIGVQVPEPVALPVFAAALGLMARRRRRV
jgi:hypothetical protein